MMRSDFAAFILSHGRPGSVATYNALRRCGYSGKIYIVIDDEDQTGDEYRRRYGDQVLTFSKQAVAPTFDEGDNFQTYRGVVYARNAVYDLARSVNVQYFIELDDDYTGFYLRFNSKLEYVQAPIRTRMDDLLSALLKFYIDTGCASVAMSQGGDHIGGRGDPNRQKVPELRRKCMNSFVLSADSNVRFLGRINEDTTMYVVRSRVGDVFFTVVQAQLNQKQTQMNSGGMTGLYLDHGTYVKSFYSVMFAPSCVKIGRMGDHRSPHYRIHHQINWGRTAPKILREHHRKPRAVSKEE